MMRSEGLRLSSLQAMAGLLLSSFANNGSQQTQASNFTRTIDSDPYQATSTSGGKRGGTVAQAKRAAIKLKRRKAHKARCR
jgi:hypothetical protein